MANDLKKVVEIILKLTDQTSGVFKKATSGAEAYTKALKQLDTLNIFKGLKAQTADALKSWKSAAESTKLFGAAMNSSKAAIASNGKALDTVKGKLKEVQTSLGANEKALKKLDSARDKGQTETKESAAAYKKLSETIDKQKKSLSGLQSEQKKLQTARTKSTADLKRQTTGYNKAKKSSDQLRSKYAEQSIALGKASQAMKRAGINTVNLAQAEKKLADNVKKAEAAFKQETAAAKKDAEAKKKSAKADQVRATQAAKSNRAIATEIKKLTTAYKTLKQAGADTARLTRHAKKLRAEVRKVRAAAKAGFGGLRSEIDKSKTKLQSLSVTVAASLTALAAALAAPFVIAVKEVAAFNTEMSAVGAVTNATAAEFTAMKLKAEDMGRTTKFTAVEAAAAMRFLGMAGLEASEVLEVLPGVLDLATAGMMDIARAADLATNIMTGYGLKAADLGGVNDILAEASTNANTNIEELGTAFAYAGSLASTTGLALEETATTLGLLANAGIKASLGGTTLRGVLSRLQAPSKKAQETMKRLGESIGQATIEITDSQGEFIGMRQIISQLEDAALETGDAVTIFGQRAGPGMLALIRQGLPAYDELHDKLVNAEGAASTLAAKMLDNLGGAFTLMTSALNGFAKEIGESLEPVLRTMVEAFTELVNVATNIKKALGPVGDGLIILGAALVATGVAVAGLAVSFVILEGAVSKIPSILASVAIRLQAYSGVAIATTAENTALAVSFGTLRVAAGKALASIVGLVAAHPVVATLALLAASVYAVAKAMDVSTERSRKAAEDQSSLAKLYREAGASYAEYADTIKKDSKKAKDAGLKLKKELNEIAKQSKDLGNDLGGEFSDKAQKAADSIDKITGSADLAGKALNRFQNEVELRSVEAQAKSLKASADHMRKLANETHVLQSVTEAYTTVLGFLTDKIVRYFDYVGIFYTGLFDFIVNLSRGSLSFLGKTYDSFEELEKLVAEGGVGKAAKLQSAALKVLKDDAQASLKQMQKFKQIDYTMTKDEILDLAVEYKHLGDKGSIQAQALGSAFEKAQKKVSDASKEIVKSIDLSIDEKALREKTEAMNKSFAAGMEKLAGDWTDGLILIQNQNHLLTEQLKTEYIVMFSNMEDTQKKGFLTRFNGHQKNLIDIHNLRLAAAEEDKLIDEELVRFQKGLEKDELDRAAKTVIEEYAVKTQAVKDGLEKQRVAIEEDRQAGKILDAEAVKQLFAAKASANTKLLEIEQDRIDAMKQLQQTDTEEFKRASKVKRALQKALSDDAIKLQEHQNQQMIKGHEKRLESVEKNLDAELKVIQTKRDEGIISEQEAAEQSNDITMTRFAEALVYADQYFEEVKSKYAKDTDEYIKAQEAVLAADNDFTDERLRILKEGQQKRKALEAAELGIAEARYSGQIIAIQSLEDKKVISHLEAIKRRSRAELTFLQLKINSAREAVDAAIVQYGRDTAAHKDATAKKIAAENEFKAAKVSAAAAIGAETKAIAKGTAERKKATEATKEGNKETKKSKRIGAAVARSGRKLWSGITGVAEAFKKLKEEAASAIEGLEDVIQSFRDLTNVAVETNKTLAETTEETLKGIPETIKEITANVHMALRTAGDGAVKVVSQSAEALQNLYGEVSETLNGLVSETEEINDKIEELSGQRVELEKSNADFIIGLQNEITGDTKDQADLRFEYEQEYSKGVEALRVGEYETAQEYFLKARDLTKDMIQEMKDFSEEILGIEKTTVDKIRDLQKGLMDDAEQWAFEKAEADRLAGEAREAMMRGEMELASQLFQQSQEMYAGLAQEVKDTEGNIIMSIEETTAAAIAGVEATGKGAAESLRAYQEDQNAIITEANNEAIALAQEAGSAAAGALDEHSRALQRQAEENEASIAETRKNIDTLIETMQKLVDTVNQKLEVDIETAAAQVALEKLTEFYGNKMANMIRHLAYAKEQMAGLQRGTVGSLEAFMGYNMQIESYSKSIQELGGRMKRANQVLEESFGIVSEGSKETNIKKYPGFVEGGLVSGSLDSKAIGTSLVGGDQTTKFSFTSKSGNKKPNKATKFTGPISIEEAMRRLGLAKGGDVDGTGGIKIPGYGRTDVVPAMLTKGERVTNSLSTRIMDKIAPGFMEGMNRIKSSSAAEALLKLFGKREKHAGGGVVGRQHLQTGGRASLQFETGGTSDTQATTDAVEGTTDAVEGTTSAIEKLGEDLKAMIQVLAGKELIGRPQEEIDLLKQQIKETMEMRNSLIAAAEKNIAATEKNIADNTNTGTSTVGDPAYILKLIADLQNDMANSRMAISQSEGSPLQQSLQQNLVDQQRTMESLVRALEKVGGTLPASPGEFDNISEQKYFKAIEKLENQLYPVVRDLEESLAGASNADEIEDLRRQYADVMKEVAQTRAGRDRAGIQLSDEDINVLKDRLVAETKQVNEGGNKLSNAFTEIAAQIGTAGKAAIKSVENLFPILDPKTGGGGTPPRLPSYPSPGLQDSPERLINNIRNFGDSGTGGEMTVNLVVGGKTFAGTFKSDTAHAFVETLEQAQRNAL